MIASGRVSPLGPRVRDPQMFGPPGGPTQINTAPIRPSVPTLMTTPQSRHPAESTSSPIGEFDDVGPPPQPQTAAHPEMDPAEAAVLLGSPLEEGTYSASQQRPNRGLASEDPFEEARAVEPRRILFRSVALLIVIVAVPSTIYNLLLPTPAAMEAIQGHVVVILSLFIGFSWLFLFLYFGSLYRQSWRAEPRFAAVLAVLMLDALRNVLESAYFGIAYSGKVILSPQVMRLLWAPQVIIVSRLLALATALVLLWLVMEQGFESLQVREKRSLQLEQRNRELAALQQIAELVSSSLESSAVLNSICREIVETLNFQSALLCLVDGPGKCLHGAAGYHVPQSLIDKTIRTLDGPDILAEVVRTASTRVIARLGPGADLNPYLKESGPTGARVVAPIQDGSGILGVIEVAVETDAPSPDDHRLALLDSFLRHAGTAIRNARLHERVLSDRERLNQLTRSLEEKNKQLESFVYMISHDLKAPLVSIQGFLSLLDTECGAGLGEDGLFYLNRVRGNAEHLQGLIQQLLELSRIGRTQREHGPINMNDLIDGIRSATQPQRSEQDISMRVQEDLPAVYGDGTQIRRLFMNLIDNSIKYMGSSKKRDIAVTCQTLDTTAEFIVSDTGIGIPPDLQDRVFQMFQRIPSAGVSVEGNGVGLAIVRKITEVHRGKVWVESEGIGSGAAFHVSLPLGPGAGEDSDEEG